MPTLTTAISDDDLTILARRAPATDDLIELAAWLHANGSQQRSLIECIELAERLITRRRFLIGAGALVLAGCGAPSVSTPTATVATTKTVTDMYGTVEVPVEPQRVYCTYDDVLACAIALDFPVIAGPGERGSAANPFPMFIDYSPETVAARERLVRSPLWPQGITTFAVNSSQMYPAPQAFLALFNSVEKALL